MKRAITHDLLRIPPNTLVKDYKPKFKKIELMVQIPIPPYAKCVFLKNVKEVNKKYGDKTLLSVMNFYDTKTTGYIIKEL